MWRHRLGDENGFSNQLNCHGRHNATRPNDRIQGPSASVCGDQLHCPRTADLESGVRPTFRGGEQILRPPIESPAVSLVPRHAQSASAVGDPAVVAVKAREQGRPGRNVLVFPSLQRPSGCRLRRQARGVKGAERRTQCAPITKRVGRGLPGAGDGSGQRGSEKLGWVRGVARADVADTEGGRLGRLYGGDELRWLPAAGGAHADQSR